MDARRSVFGAVVAQRDGGRLRRGGGGHGGRALLVSLSSYGYRTGL